AGGGGAAGGGVKEEAKAKGDGGSKRPKEQLDDVPLMIPQAVCRDTKASLLVHLRDEALNFAGDTGAVGRIAVAGKKKGRGLTFDLKGQQFSGQIIPSATIMVVGVGRTEAKVEGLFSEVCRLDYKGNVFDSMGGEVLKGEMDDSYKFEEEDDESGKTPKLGRKKSITKKRGSSSQGSSTRKGAGGGGAKGLASKRAKKS
ncbi:unnamed protein product, partial [Scytosiphon promiscuus]